jgi:hypothetical protein
MKKDFSIDVYKKKIIGLQQQAFSFVPLREFMKNQERRTICLRHDVDLLPQNSLAFAKIQYNLGIRGSYYFRAIPQSWDESVIKEVHDLGHEVGYHYECLTTTRGNLQKAIEDFEKNLKSLQKLVPVNTICMHGSPRSMWDSKELWKFYNYRDFGIEAEPYFDVDFSNTLYLTDTGRRWNGNKVSVRDKVRNVGESTLLNEESQKHTDWKVKPKLNSSMNMTKEAISFQDQYNFKSTFEIIRAAENGQLPDKIMMTFHPQRWTEKPMPWLKELVWQNTKNVVKYFLVKIQQ